MKLSKKDPYKAVGKILADNEKGVHPVVLSHDEWMDHINNMHFKFHYNLPEYNSDFWVPIVSLCPNNMDSCTCSLIHRVPRI